MSEIDTLLDAPCAICGYSGPHYWQRESHSRGCPWHYVGGAAERERALRALLPRLSTDAKQPIECPSCGKIAEDSSHALNCVLGRDDAKRQDETR